MALDWLKSIFGGSEEQSQSTSTPISMTPEVFKNLRPQFADSLSGLLSTGGPQYSGPLYSPMTATEGNILGGLNAQTGAGTARAGLLQDTIQGKFLPGQPGSNPFLDAAIQAAQRPTLQGLEETLGRTLPGRFNLAGQSTAPGGSSAFDRAGAIATRGAADALGDIATKISAGNYEAERGRQTQAVALDQAEVDATVKNLKEQALPRLIQELGIERGMQEFQTRTAALLDILKTLAGVTAPVVANVQQSTGMKESVTSPFHQVLPGGVNLPK